MLSHGQTSLHPAVASQYLAALSRSRPCFLILSCSAYLACVQSWGCNEHHAHTSPHVDGPTAVPRIRPRTRSLVCGALCATHAHTHTDPHLRMCPQHLRLQRGGVVKYAGPPLQVAMTDLEDVVDGGGQRPAYGGYL